MYRQRGMDVKLQLKGVLLMGICNFSNVRIVCISTDICKQSMAQKGVMCFWNTEVFPFLLTY